MYTIKDLDKEITDTKAGWAGANNGVPKGWLVNAVMSKHANVTGDDSDFALCGSRYAVERRVEAHFREIKENEENPTNPQLILPGYEKLQKEYIVERNDEQVAISIWDMTDEEIDWKADQHRAMGRGHFAHADELIRFKESRKANGYGEAQA